MGWLASTEIAGVNDQMTYENQKKEKKIPTATAEATLFDWQVISGNSRAKKKTKKTQGDVLIVTRRGLISPANL